MLNTTVANAQKNLQSLIDMTIDSNELVSIVSDKGNVVLLNEDDYHNLLLTLEVYNNPEFKNSLIQASNSINEFIDESEVEW